MLFLPDPNAVSTVFIGDSITQKWNLSLFFPSAPYVNAGISGETTDVILARFDSDVIALKPKTVIILAGTNDILRHRAQAPAILCIQAMITKAQAANIDVAIATLPPVASDLENWGTIYANYDYNPDILAFNVALSQLGVPVVDYHAALTDSDGHLVQGTLVDGIHPSTEGYRRMTKYLRQLIP